MLIIISKSVTILTFLLYSQLPYIMKNYFFKIICIFNNKINIYIIIMNLYKTSYKFKNIVLMYQNNLA